MSSFAAVRMVWECAPGGLHSICGVGGVETGEDAAEFILAELSQWVLQAFDHCVLRILNELTDWAKSQEVSDIHELIGAVEC